MKSRWKEFESPMPYCRAFRWGVTVVFVGQEPGIGWHLSISTPRRNPTWEEIKSARYELVPDSVTMAMLLPPKDEYVNVHEFCFHLHQIANEDRMDEQRKVS
jgi:hypothetical protein